MSSTEVEPGKAADNADVFQKALRGDLGLPMTYWGLGIGGGLLLALILGISSALIASPLFTAAVAAVVIAYWILVSIAIWNAATRYAGPKGWAITAKVLVVLGALNTLGYFGTLLEDLHDPGQARVRQAAEAANRDLPRMLDGGTRLKSVSAEKHQLTYHLELVNKKTAEVDRAGFGLAQRAQLVSRVCDNDKIKSLMGRDVALAYRYSGNDDTLIADIVLTSKDCAR